MFSAEAEDLIVRLASALFIAAGMRTNTTPTLATLGLDEASAARPSRAVTCAPAPAAAPFVGDPKGPQRPDDALGARERQGDRAV